MTETPEGYVPTAQDFEDMAQEMLRTEFKWPDIVVYGGEIIRGRMVKGMFQAEDPEHYAAITERLRETAGGNGR